MRQQANRALKQARQEILEAERRISDLQQLVRAAPCLPLPPVAQSGSDCVVHYVWLLLHRPTHILHGFHRSKRLGIRKGRCSNRLHS